VAQDSARQLEAGGAGQSDVDHRGVGTMRDIGGEPGLGVARVETSMSPSPANMAAQPATMIGWSSTISTRNRGSLGLRAAPAAILSDAKGSR